MFSRRLSKGFGWHVPTYLGAKVYTAHIIRLVLTTDNIVAVLPTARNGQDNFFCFCVPVYQVCLSVNLAQIIS